MAIPRLMKAAVSRVALLSRRPPLLAPPAPPAHRRSLAAAASSARVRSGGEGADQPTAADIMQQVRELKAGFHAHHGELKALAAELHGAVTSLSARLDDALGESADAHNDLARIKAMLQANFPDCRSSAWMFATQMQGCRSAHMRTFFITC